MIIYPAIDIRDEKVVRLTKGDYDVMDVYSPDPLEIVKKFELAGATHLHTVDLDGARDGSLINFETIKKIAKNSNLFIQTGGGIRNEDRIKQYLDIGVSRVILGTVAIENFKFVEDMVAKYGDAIAVGVDALNSKIAICGWKKITDISSFDFCYKLRDVGVKTVIYTDISKDGAMQGTNLEAYLKLSSVEGLDIIASGGITFYDEIEKLSDMNLHGAILGKALYENKLDLAKSIKICGKV